MRRFCLLTTGRAGSTALMDAIARAPDVAVPTRQLPACRDHELVHPQTAAGHARRLARLTGRPIRSLTALIEAFFELNADLPYAGFKSMPNRHPDLDDFVRRSDLQVITLLRRDRLATAASFLLALTQGTWRRSGGTPEFELRLDASNRPLLRDNLAYLHRSERLLEAVPDAIRLSYEDLCEADFAAPGLDRFFGRRIRIEAPRAPIRAQDYVADFAEFEAFVNGCWAELTAASD